MRKKGLQLLADLLRDHDFESFLSVIGWAEVNGLSTNSSSTSGSMSSTACTKALVLRALRVAEDMLRTN